MSPQAFPIVLLFWLLGASAVEAHSPSLQLISEEEWGFTLEFTLPPFDIETHQINDQPCHQIYLPSLAKTFEPGLPELPVQGALVQVPPSGKIITKIVEQQSDILTNIQLCSVPNLEVSEAGRIAPQYFENEAVYQNLDFWPANLIEIGPRNVLRDIPVSRLRIFPFQWNPLTQELRYFNQIRIQVQFEQPISSPSVRARSNETSAAYETVLQNLIFNYQGAARASSSPSIVSTRVKREPSESAQEHSTTRTIKQNDRLRIEILEEGIYRLSYEQLAEAGLQPQFLRPDRLRLFNRGEEVAIKVVSQEPAQLNPNDYIEFYAQGLNTTFTDTNVYWLQWRKKGSGNRIAQIDGQVTGQGEKIQAFYEILHREEDKKVWVDTPGAPARDYWFWDRITAPDTEEYTFNIFSPSSEFTDAIIRVEFQDYSYFTHHTLLKLNNTLIKDEYWQDQLIYLPEISVSSELFQEGNNTLTIRMPGDTEDSRDSVYLNWFEVEYWREFDAVEDNLVFTVAGNDRIQEIQINQLTQADIAIYDITHPNHVAEIVNFTVEGNDKNYQAIFEKLASEHKTYYILTEPQIKSPFKLVPWKSTQLKSRKNAADYLLITAQEFLPVVEPLTERRRQQGLRVKSVSVEDIYNEFNEGVFDPTAIKKFLKFAYENWSRPAPTYVFLVGEAHLNYKGSGKKINKVPARLSAASWDDTLIADDSWYVSVDGEDDVLPDMFIGRIPGNNSEQIAELIDKIIRFETATKENSRRVLLVADSDSDFEDLNETLADSLPAGFDADKIYLRSYLEDTNASDRDEKIAEATQDIISSMNKGVMISNYIGHGLMDRWSGSKGLFKPENVQGLNNENKWLFAMMLSCINGYFVDPNKYSLAEEFLLARGGAVGALAPSKVSYLGEDTLLATEVFSVIFEEQQRNLGLITTQAKIAAYERGASADLIKKFTLFGDPALNLTKW